jgi:hypothetical protein
MGPLASDWWGACPPALYDSCCENCDQFVDDYNKLLLWYPSEKECGGWEFLYETWKNYMNVYSNIDPYYFCVSNAGTCSSTLNGINTFIPNNDYQYFYYE